MMRARVSKKKISSLLFIIALISVSIFVPASYSDSNTWQVAASGHDMTERGDGTFTLTDANTHAYTNPDPEISSYLCAGYYWTGINIPQGAIITTATFEGYVYGTSHDDPALDIYGNDVNTAATFTANSHVISEGFRPRTDAVVPWVATGIGAGWNTSPELKTIIQEIVDRPGWSSGNAIVLLFIARVQAQKKLAIRAEDYSVGELAAKLHITWTTNNAPTITSASISDRDDGDNCYEMESYYYFVAVVNDGDGAVDIAKVYIQIKQGGAVRAEVRGTSLDGVPSYSIQTGAAIIDIDVGSCSWVENGDEGTLTIPIRFEWDYTDEANLEIAVYVEDTAAASAGFTVMQTDYFDVIGRLVIYNFAVDDGRINLGGIATFSGEIFYSDTMNGDNPSSKYPPDAQFTDVAIHDPGHVEKGTDATIINGVFSGIAFAIPSAVQSNTYHVYLDLVADYSDADAPDGDTVAVIGDRIKILTLTSDVVLLEVGEFAELRATAELEFDNHALGAGDSIEINGEELIWDAGDSRFEVLVTSGIAQTITYNAFTDGFELTFTITSGNMDGKSVAIEWTIYPPGVPTLLFGAGFNASAPYVELYWTHNLTKVTVFEIQNSSDAIAWDYLGVSTTTNYTDNEVFNGTARYYRVRACNNTDENWYNSSFGHPDFEIVYFTLGVNGIGVQESDAPWIAIAIILSIIAFLLATGIKR